MGLEDTKDLSLGARPDPPTSYPLPSEEAPPEIDQEMVCFAFGLGLLPCGPRTCTVADVGSLPDTVTVRLTDIGEDDPEISEVEDCPIYDALSDVERRALHAKFVNGDVIDPYFKWVEFLPE